MSSSIVRGFEGIAEAGSTRGLYGAPWDAASVVQVGFYFTSLYRAPTSRPTSTPTSAPTACYQRHWPVTPSGLVVVPQCAYGSGGGPTVRLNNATTMIRFRGLGLADPSALGQFASWISALPTAITLDLTDNTYTVLIARAFEPFGGTVSALDLSYGTITLIDANAFFGLTALTSLSLTHNLRLTYLPDGLLINMQQLAEFDVAACGLTNVTTAIFDGATRLARLRLADNPLLSMPVAPFRDHPQLEPDNVFLGNTSIICVPIRATSGGTRPLCVACSTDDGNTYTTFRSVPGRYLCDQPISIVALNSPRQYTPPNTQDTEYLTWGNRTKYAIGRTYHIQGVDFDSVRLANGDNLSRVDTVVQFSVSNPPAGLFIDQSTGELQFTPRAISSRFSALTAAVVGYTGSALLVNLSVHVREEDVKNGSAVGPNGRTCFNNGTKVDNADGESEFDGRFACDCLGTDYTGPNCGILVAAAASSQEKSASSVPLYAAIAAIALLVVTVGAVWRYRAYRVEHSPTNLKTLQSEILESLGIGSTLDISSAEFGIVLSIPKLVAAAFEPHALDSTVRGSLITALAVKRRRTSLMGPRAGNTPLATLDVDGARIKIDGEDGRVLVVFKVPAGADPESFAEEVVTTLQRAASTDTLVVGNLIVDDVSAAVPQCIPREVHRNAIVRLQPLGEGNFAEVVRVEVNEGHRSIVYPAAAKILKVGHGDSRTALLKEAALMALLQHPNIVQLIGVVTVPRSMPALLLLTYCEHGALDEFVASPAAEGLDTSMLLSFCADIAAGLSYLSSRRIVHRDVGFVLATCCA